MRRRVLLAGMLVMLAVGMGRAQILGTGPQTDFRDTSMLKPPAGQKVALVVFEDLGCPACARAHPFEMRAVEELHIPLERHDFPIPAHIWTFQGAVCARYLQDKVSPRLAEQYRSDVFAAQSSILSKEDLQQFNQRWFPAHGQALPFVMDPTGALGRAVQADFDLGRRLNLRFTPTIVVVTPQKYQVICGGTGGLENDPARIEPVLEAAIAQTKTQGGTAGHPRRAAR